jgi:hypothetical protein
VVDGRADACDRDKRWDQLALQARRPHPGSLLAGNSQIAKGTAQAQVAIWAAGVTSLGCASETWSRGRRQGEHEREDGDNGLPPLATASPRMTTTPVDSHGRPDSISLYISTVRSKGLALLQSLQVDAAASGLVRSELTIFSLAYLVGRLPRLEGQAALDGSDRVA